MRLKGFLRFSGGFWASCESLKVPNNRPNKKSNNLEKEEMYLPSLSTFCYESTLSTDHYMVNTWRLVEHRYLLCCVLIYLSSVMWNKEPKTSKFVSRHPIFILQQKNGIVQIQTTLLFFGLKQKHQTNCCVWTIRPYWLFPKSKKRIKEYF